MSVVKVKRDTDKFKTEEEFREALGAS